MASAKILINTLHFPFIEEWIYLILGNIGVEVHIKEISSRVLAFPNNVAEADPSPESSEETMDVDSHSNDARGEMEGEDVREDGDEYCRTEGGTGVGNPVCRNCDDADFSTSMGEFMSR